MGDTTLVDIFEAAGGKVSEDRKSVVIDGANPLKSIDIVLRVYPRSVRIEQPYRDGKPEEYITFDIILDPGLRIGETTVMGTPIEEILYDEGFELPVAQVRLLKETK